VIMEKPNFLSHLNKKTKPETLVGYDPFIINRMLSRNIDCISDVYELTRRHGMPADMQFSYLFFSTPRAVRNQDWNAVRAFTIPDRIKVIMEYYEVSYLKAKELEILMSEKDWKNIESTLSKDEVKKTK